VEDIWKNTLRLIGTVESECQWYFCRAICYVRENPLKIAKFTLVFLVQWTRLTKTVYSKCLLCLVFLRVSCCSEWWGLYLPFCHDVLKHDSIYIVCNIHSLHISSIYIFIYSYSCPLKTTLLRLWARGAAWRALWRPPYGWRRKVSPSRRPFPCGRRSATSPRAASVPHKSFWTHTNTYVAFIVFSNFWRVLLDNLQTSKVCSFFY